MNRRSFFRKLVLGTAAFSILPPATTYERIWKARREINPEWVNAGTESELDLYYAPWLFHLPKVGVDSERVEISELDLAGKWSWIEHHV